MSITDEEYEKILQPYTQEVGRLVYEWNALQEQLCDIFAIITGIDEGRVADAIWHSTRSDLAQRSMLRAAVEAKNFDLRQKQDVLWLIDKVDKSLSHKRNDGIHAPVIVFTDMKTNVSTLEVNRFSNNPRALALAGKEFIEELRWYRSTAEALHLYAINVYWGLHTDEPWPERPELPSRGQKTTATETTPAEPGKEQ